MPRYLDELGDAVRQTIRAFHGSPYDFDKFDASKIGTGEGAQAYGHGLYFAGNEGVAREYRERLKGIVDAPVPDELGDEYQAIVREIRDLTKQRASATGAEFERLKSAIDDAFVRHQDVQHRIQTAAENPGHMYEVEIGHPESVLLDWDRPLRSQEASVKERLAPFRTGRYELGQEADYELGATALHRIASAFDSDMGEASAALRKAGIPGIKYWDAGSRSAHQGTRNYVMFPGTEDQIRILRKYGLLAPMAAAGTMGEE